MKKEPANHCLKSRGLPISRGVPTTGPLTGTVATATHEIPFQIGQQRLKALQGKSLRISPNLRHNRTMQVGGTTRPPAMSQPLMEFPNRITKPGELERSKV